MLAASRRSVVNARSSKTLMRSMSTEPARQFQYFDNLEIKNNVAIVRLNGPGKMNTISTAMQVEADKIFREQIFNNKEVKAVVFLSSKPDNFIAGTTDVD
jgi:hypothetical protein